jgi:predicted secreted hydrolase
MTVIPNSPAPSDWSADLPPEADYCLLEADDVPMFSENFWFVGYDLENQVGHFLHLGADPTNFAAWDESLIIAFDTDEYYTHAATGGTRTPARVAGPLMTLHNTDPFRSWHLTYEGPAAATTLSAMQAGVIREDNDESHTLSLDFEIETVAPAFLAANGGKHAEAHEGQAFSTHYEQMYRVNGTVTVDGKTRHVGGFGLRDHSRGPRDLTGWGTHGLIGGAFPSGKAFGLFKVLSKDGVVRLEEGYVYDGTAYRRAVKTEHTVLTDVNATPGEQVLIRLHLEDGDVVKIQGEAVTASLLTFDGHHGGKRGVDWSNPEATVLMESFPRWTWDGEVGGGILERTATLKNIKRP